MHFGFVLFLRQLEVQHFVARQNNLLLLKILLLLSYMIYLDAMAILFSRTV